MYLLSLKSTPRRSNHKGEISHFGNILYFFYSSPSICIFTVTPSIFHRRFYFLQLDRRFFHIAFLNFNFSQKIFEFLQSSFTFSQSVRSTQFYLRTSVRPMSSLYNTRHGRTVVKPSTWKILKSPVYFEITKNTKTRAGPLRPQ